jgi:hypothetical protein
MEAAGIAGAIAVALAACGGSTKAVTQSNPAAASSTPTSATTSTSVSTPTSATTSTSSQAAAKAPYKAAFNTMTAADNAGIRDQNSNDPSTSSRGTQARVTAREQFDSAVRAIAFPSSLSSDAQAVLSADASVEHALIILGASTGSVSTFNAAFATFKQERDKFTAANDTLLNALGLTTTGQATP